MKSLLVGLFVVPFLISCASGRCEMDSRDPVCVAANNNGQPQVSRRVPQNSPNTYDPYSNGSYYDPYSQGGGNYNPYPQQYPNYPAYPPSQYQQPYGY